MSISKTMAAGFALLWVIGSLLIHPIVLVVSTIIFIDVLDR